MAETNSMTKIYIGFVEEVIRDSENNPTLELRVRVPTIHGPNSTSGLVSSSLPIAKPLILPGMLIDKTFIEFIKNTDRVYIIFEFGDYTKPVYFGIRNDQSLYNMSSGILESLNYATATEKGVIRLEVIDETAYIYTQD